MKRKTYYQIHKNKKPVDRMKKQDNKHAYKMILQLSNLVSKMIELHKLRKVIIPIYGKGINIYSGKLKDSQNNIISDKTQYQIEVDGELHHIPEPTNFNYEKMYEETKKEMMDKMGINPSILLEPRCLHDDKMKLFGLITKGTNII